MKRLERLQARVRHKEEGFTLVEMLVVILIIGILAAIAIAIFMNQRTSAVEASIKSDLRNAGTVYQGSYKNGQGYDERAVLQSPKSEGNTVSVSTVTPMKEGFCLVGTNSSYTDSVFYYSSMDGGITDNSEGCIESSGNPGGGGDEGIAQCSPASLAYVVADKNITLFKLNNPEWYALTMVDSDKLSSAQKNIIDTLNVSFDDLWSVMLQAQGEVLSSPEETQILTEIATRVSSSENYSKITTKLSQYETELKNVNESAEFNDFERVTQLQNELRDATENYYNEWC